MKPMPFNADMTRAVLDDRKTETRRPVKPQPTGAHDVFGPSEEDDGTFEFFCGGFDGSKFCDWITAVKMPCQPGDIMYVPEAWKCRFAMLDQDGLGYEIVFRDGKIIRFRFEDKKRARTWAKYARKNDNHWQSPYFMPKEAARIFLRVTDVRAERLQSMLPCDVQKEGCPYSFSGFDEEQAPDWFGWMKDVWDSTIKPSDRAIYSWVANPWVWVIKFERISKEEAYAHG